LQSFFPVDPAEIVPALSLPAQKLLEFAGGTGILPVISGGLGVSPKIFPAL